MAASSRQGGIRRQPWENRDYGSEDEPNPDSSDDEPDPEKMSVTDCSTEFYNMVVHLKISGVISAKQACILSFWAKKGGLCDPGGSLAVHPARIGGAFSKHFDKTVGLDKEMQADFYRLSMPAFQRWSLGRSLIDCDVNLAHERLKEHIDAAPDFFEKVDEAAKSSGWADRYRNHELLKVPGGDRLVPLALYIDGVPFLKRDSAIGFWLSNLATGQRVLVMSLRKRQLCRCGCKHWCSFWTAFSYLRWVLAIMVEGRYPAHRHDGSAWPEGKHADQAGQPLGYRAVVLFIKADWAEFCHTVGFWQWSHHGHPCFKCFCTGGPLGNIARFSDVSVLDLPWTPKDAAAYELACQTAEIRVVVASAALLAQLLGHLQYDKRKKGSQGRSLMADLPALRLAKGDRLEPDSTCPDVGAIDFRTDFPISLVFWRPERTGLCKHRNPLFHASTHVTPDCAVVDEMHTMHLGVFAAFISACLWAIILADVWKLGENLPQEVGHERSAQKMQQELTIWYAQQKREHLGKPIYELADFNLKVLGSRDSPALSAKAAETGTLLGFATDLCRLHQRSLARGPALTRAGEALVDYMDITRRAQGRMLPRERQLLMDAVLRFLALRSDAAVPWIPKMHLMIHLVHQCAKFGNPREVATWVDEGLNRQLASVCKTAHALVWHRRVLATMNHLLGKQSTKGVKRRA
jgi:hypothetical protein